MLRTVFRFHPLLAVTLLGSMVAHIGAQSSTNPRSSTATQSSVTPSNPHTFATSSAEVNSTGVVFRVPDGNRDTVIDPSLLYEGVLSGVGSGPLPWGLNLVSLAWLWGQDPITYHAGDQDVR